MELSYWESRWRKGKTGFHMPDGYPGLDKYWNRLALPPKPVVFVPLCGKTVDLVKLENLGATVIGVEISAKAVIEFFDEQNRSYETDSFGGFTIRRSGAIEIWQGDFFKFPESKHPKFDLIYDKAALTAMPSHMRERYSNSLLSHAGRSAAILLHQLIYPQKQMPGPPFSVSDAEAKRLFSDHFNFQILEENTIPAENFPQFQLRGLKSPLKERLLYLIPSQ